MSSTINPEVLHKKAGKLLPNLSLLPTSTWCAILRHDVKTLDDIKDSKSFMWIKAHPKITLKTLAYYYYTRYPIDHLNLQHGHQVPNEILQVGDVRAERPKDHWIAFRARDLEDVTEMGLANDIANNAVLENGNGLGPQKLGRDESNAIVVEQDEDEVENESHKEGVVPQHVEHISEEQDCSADLMGKRADEAAQGPNHATLNVLHAGAKMPLDHEKGIYQSKLESPIVNQADNSKKRSRGVQASDEDDQSCEASKRLKPAIELDPSGTTDTTSFEDYINTRATELTQALQERIGDDSKEDKTNERPSANSVPSRTLPEIAFDAGQLANTNLSTNVLYHSALLPQVEFAPFDASSAGYQSDTVNLADICPRPNNLMHGFADCFPEENDPLNASSLESYAAFAEDMNYISDEQTAEEGMAESKTHEDRTNDENGGSEMGNEVQSEPEGDIVDAGALDEDSQDEDYRDDEISVSDE